MFVLKPSTSSTTSATPPALTEATRTAAIWFLAAALLRATPYLLSKLSPRY